MPAYFAYGSNLCAEQMARRCVGAVDPRPAVLDGHTWLINQRGVATVRAAPGARVHGVVWQVSDDDLAALDLAESVPAHYRRFRLPVRTQTGSELVWVYIDYRVRPGPARPGYLERVLDGAARQRLPAEWLDFLRGWTPAI